MGQLIERAEPAPGWSWARLEIPDGEYVDESGARQPAYYVVVVPDRLRWTRTVEGEVRVVADFAVMHGKVLCTGVQHFGSVERPVSSTAIRDVALDEVGRAALVGLAMSERSRESTAQERESGDESAAFFDVRHVEPTAGERKGVDRALKGTRGRPPIPQEELESVAETYRSAGSRPTQAVERVHGLSSGQAARRIRAARDAGLLPPTTAGKARA